MGKYFLLSFLAALFFVFSAEAKLVKPTEPDFNVLHYKIDLVLNEKDLSFQSKVDIEVESEKEGLKEVTLHYQEGERKIRLPKPLSKGEKTVVTVQGEGKAKERNQHGLFAVRPEKGGLPQFYTQFEPTGAREVFPCYDEPFDKATTEVTITADSRYTLLSNGKLLLQEILEDGRKKVHFVNGDPISTYHITFVAAELVPVKGSYRSRFGKKVPLTIYTRPGTEKEVTYAMEALKKQMDFFEKYFGMAYPWDAYGLVSLPGFSYSGMENKGLANINEARLLWDKTHLVSKKIWISWLLAHELAHEWFGNMVTMTWWDDLWLNEAFASFVSTEYIAEEFGRSFTVIDNYQWLAQGYFPQDQGALSHPIVPGEVDSLGELFDSITYAKGLQVVNMLENLIGPETFRKGIKDYFERHRLQNASTADFIAAMERASRRSLKRFAQGWLYQKGYPQLLLTGLWDGKEKQYRLQVGQESGPFEFRLNIGNDSYLISEPMHTFVIPSKEPVAVLPINQDGEALLQYRYTGNDKSLVLAKAADTAYARFESIYRILTRPDLSEQLREDLYTKELVAILIAHLRNPEPVVPFGVSWALIGNQLGQAASQRLSRALWKEAKALYVTLSQKDPVEAVTRAQLLTILGQADLPELYPFLKAELKADSFDDRLGALAGLLRSEVPERYDLLEAMLKREAGVQHAKLEILKTLAKTPRPEVLAKVNRYLSDETLVPRDDSTIPIQVWRSLTSENSKIVYSKEGIREVSRFVEKNLDRSNVAGTALRSLQEAKEATPALKKEIREQIGALLKKEPPEYVRSVGLKILEAAK